MMVQSLPTCTRSHFACRRSQWVGVWRGDFDIPPSVVCILRSTGVSCAGLQLHSSLASRVQWGYAMPATLLQVPFVHISHLIRVCSHPSPHICMRCVRRWPMMLMTTATPADHKNLRRHERYANLPTSCLAFGFHEVIHHVHKQTSCCRRRSGGISIMVDAA